jgi:hypothetical protein
VGEADNAHSDVAMAEVHHTMDAARNAWEDFVHDNRLLEEGTAEGVGTTEIAALVQLLVVSADLPFSFQSLRATLLSLSCTFRVLPFPCQRAACAPLHLHFSTTLPKAARFPYSSYQDSSPIFPFSSPVKSTRKHSSVASEHLGPSSPSCMGFATGLCT